MQYTTLTSDEAVKRAITQPTSFDMLDSEYWMLKKIVPGGTLAGIEAKQLKRYDDIMPIFTKGTRPSGKELPRIGTAPIKVQFLEGAESKKLAPEASSFLSLIPTVYNADTLGIGPDLIEKPVKGWA